jgi:hypothetical protein
MAARANFGLQPATGAKQTIDVLLAATATSSCCEATLHHRVNPFAGALGTSCEQLGFGHGLAIGADPLTPLSPFSVPASSVRPSHTAVGRFGVSDTNRNAAVKSMGEESNA